MTYILELTDKNPKYNQITKCTTAEEADFLKMQAEKMGFEVKIKRVEGKR